jgi:hypothetical protein
MNELRSTFAIRVARGALIQPDGRAVGLVLGGGPPWELLARAARVQAGADYHRLLLALDTPLDVYLVDTTLDASDEMAQLLACQEQALELGATIYAAVLGEIGGYLSDLAFGQVGISAGVQAKQVVWVVAADTDAGRGSSSLDLHIWLHRRPVVHPASDSAAAGRGLQPAIERARRLADALLSLGAAPPPRLMEPEEIMALVYRLADPVRARRFPLHGALLDRVRRVVL